MRKYNAFFAGILLVVAALWANIAEARVTGHFEPLLDINYSIHDSFDGVSGDDYMLGGGLRLNFDIALGFSAGVEYARYQKEGDIFEIFDTSYNLHTLKFNVGWRYGVTDWFEPYVMAIIGPDFHSYELHGYTGLPDMKLVDINNKALLGAGGVLGMRFQLPDSWRKSWKTWDAFNLGIFIESGYIYRMPLEISYAPENTTGAPQSYNKGIKPGEIKSGGPVLRMGLFIRF